MTSVKRNKWISKVLAIQTFCCYGILDHFKIIAVCRPHFMTPNCVDGYLNFKNQKLLDQEQVFLEFSSVFLVGMTNYEDVLIGGIQGCLSLLLLMNWDNYFYLKIDEASGVPVKMRIDLFTEVRKCLWKWLHPYCACLVMLAPGHVSDQVCKNFYWSIVLQCCVTSYCAAKRISYLYTYILFLDFLPT